MKSKQLNFFVTRQDHITLEVKLREATSFLAIEALGTGGEARILESTVVKSMGAERLDIYLLRPQDLERVSYKHIASRDEWLVDTMLSPVLEFTRCYERGNELRRGRFYAVLSYFGEGQQRVDKPQEFTAWVDILLHVAKKNLHHREGPIYFGQEAMRVKLAGGQLIS